MSVRRRPKLAKSVDAVMNFVESEMAKVLAADPAVEAARQRAARRAGRAARRQAERASLPAY